MQESSLAANPEEADCMIGQDLPKEDDSKDGTVSKGSAIDELEA